jgi:CRISPR system Cascade subunit CasD
MSTLLLRLEGPLQSYCVSIRARLHPTLPFPSKSGVIGLLANALGRTFDSPIDDLANLKMGVRVDRGGTVIREFAIAKNVMRANGKIKESEPLTLFYVADAIFLVGLEGDRALLKTIFDALVSPARILYLGRKSCMPSAPIALLPESDSLTDNPLLDALTDYPYIGKIDPVDKLLQVIDSDDGDSINDVPISFSQNGREHASRFVTYRLVDPVLAEVVND